MKKQELEELKKAITGKNATIKRFCGCYVNEEARIVSTFEDNPYSMLDDEIKEFTDRLKKCLSGTIGKVLLEVEYSTAEVASGAHHQMLRNMRDSKLEDKTALNAFYEKMAAGFVLPTNYLIILAVVSYDVPNRKKDTAELGDNADSGNIFDYMVCAVCPVKQERDELSYFDASQKFRLKSGEWVAKAPFCGFTFPAFTDRATDLYHAIYYTKSGKVDEFVDVALGTQAPISSLKQAEAFNAAFAELGDEGSFEALQAVREDIDALKQEHEDAHAQEPFSVSVDNIAESLDAYGVTGERVKAFAQKLKDMLDGQDRVDPRITLGSDACVIEPVGSHVSVKTRENSESEFRVQVVGGRKYLMIPIDEGVVVNGIEVESERRDSAESEQKDADQMTIPGI